MYYTARMTIGFYTFLLSIAERPRGSAVCFVDEKTGTANFSNLSIVPCNVTFSTLINGKSNAAIGKLPTLSSNPGLLSSSNISDSVEILQNYLRDNQEVREHLVFTVKFMVLYFL